MLCVYRVWRESEYFCLLIDISLKTFQYSFKIPISALVSLIKTFSLPIYL